MLNYTIYMPDGEFNRISISDIDDKDGVTIIYDLLKNKSKLTKLLFRIHLSVRVNRIIKLPFKSIWCKQIVPPDMVQNGIEECYIFHYRYYSLKDCGLFEYLKKRDPGCKLVFWLRDKFELISSNFSSGGVKLDVDYLKSNFDIVLTYNKLDADKYGFIYYDDFDSKIPIMPDKNYPISDLFFAGADKGRLNSLIKIYERFRSCGLNCKFYITGVPEDQQVYKEEIIYASDPMSYREMLKNSIDSRCILEIGQDGAVGYTSRAIEAFMYNKKLITNSRIVLDSPLYNPKYVQYFDNIDEIDPSFVLDNTEVDYHYNGEYSPLEFLRHLENKLSGN